MKVKQFIDMNNPDDELVQEVNQVFKNKDHFSSYGQNVRGIRFHRDQDGTYVVSDHFLFGGPNDLTTIENLTVRKVEVVETSGYFGHLKMGVYRTEKARGIVDEFVSDYKDITRITVVADDMDSAEELFSAIRAGELQPETEWKDRNDGSTPESSDQPAA